ncbi:DUF4432 family protein [Sphingomonas sp. M1-B02]|uniref:DUF4432 family protein n=1 Tax=Sphingomonas sp. M1-B02 TaxID=3114300 RepID=UPI002240D00F|nr:DUF4432 family protein [Sphingomonas sp. S6-11]UZK65447.1 DUF4432 family protein [Sphingomonas sp. S6-11]
MNNDLGFLPRAAHRNHGCRTRDFLWRGLRCISIENAIVRAVICIDKGTDILELLHKPSDTEMLTQAPAGTARAGDRFSSPLAEGPFRDAFPGGWYIMLPNGPEPCQHQGASFGFHGEATFLGWDAHVEEDGEDRVALCAHVRLRRLPLLIERRFSIDVASSTLVLEEAITSEAAVPIDVLWGHHPTFGAPLIENGTRIDLPPSLVKSADNRPLLGTTLAELGRFPEATTGIADFHRVDGFEEGWFAISNDRRGAAVALRWDERVFPMMGIWRVAGGESGYPWYGARQMLAIEPACDLPSVATAAARGSAVTLQPGETRSTTLEATLFVPHGTVTSVDWAGSISFAR